MPHYEKSEDLPIWQLSREVAMKIYQLTKTGKFARDLGLKSQIQRAAVSVVSNIAEGFERRSDKEFIHFLNIAKASAGEVRAQLYLALDLEYIAQDQQTELNESLANLAAQIAGFMRYLQSKNRTPKSDQPLAISH